MNGGDAFICDCAARFKGRQCELCKFMWFLSTHTHKHTHRVGSVKIGCVFARAANELNESVGIPGYQIRIFIKRFL